MLVQVERRLWTVEEYHAMAEAGILREDDRLELIEGEIIAMSPIGVRHMACVNRLNDLFTAHFRGRAVVSVQNPVRLGERSEPEPDVTLLNYREDYYASQAPASEDVLLVVEVADATLPYERNVKRPLYAHFGVPEYWLINLVDNTVEVHRQPEDDTYLKTVTRYQNESVSVGAFPNSAFQVSDLTNQPRNN